MIITSMNTPLSQVVHATGKMKLYQVGTSITICTILPISWLFLKMGYSPVSTFIVSIVVTIINQGVCLILLKKIFPYSIRTYIKQVVLPCFFLVVISPILPYITHHVLEESFLRLCLVVFVSIVTTALFSYYLVLSRGEKDMIIDYVKKFQSKIRK